MLLELQKGIIYGPVNSRRLGRSLGINILPGNRKVCPFNCVYCQYGWTKFHCSKIQRFPELPSVKATRQALKDELLAMSFPPAYITFSGNGEPTLHPDFGLIVEEVITVRNQLAPEAKTAVLSNSVLIYDNTIKNALEKLDVKIMKLDCGEEKTFKKYNQPCSGIKLEDITAGLKKLSDVTIQTLISSGKSGNFNSDNITSWVKRIKRINPLSVQIYTIDRGYPAKGLKPARKKELDQIKTTIQKSGISAAVF
ncbi:MAG: radical SAM protein [Candidatus Aminicenantaceae bacterium]